MDEEFISEGQFEISEIVEDSTTIVLNPPLEINFTVYKKLIEDRPVGKVAYIQYDFGMSDLFRIDYESDSIINAMDQLGYDKLSKEPEDIDIIKSIVKFDISHAFLHTEMDPNYKHLHWALSKWLEPRVTINEK